MKILLIDFETTGIDTTTDRIIEVGAMLVDEKWDVLKSLSFLVKDQSYPALTADIQRITNISQEDLDKNGISPNDFARQLSDFIEGDLNYAVAFNRSFDENIFKTEMARGGFGMFPGINRILQVPWLCAMVDIESNYQFKSWKQAHLALEYGITVNPKELHRAVADVELMRKILIESKATPQSLYDFQIMPWVFLHALIPAPWTDGGVGKNAAVKAGYNWEVAKGTDGPKFEKTWVKRVKKHKVEDEIKSVPFKVREAKV